MMFDFNHDKLSIISNELVKYDDKKKYDKYILTRYWEKNNENKKQKFKG